MMIIKQNESLKFHSKKLNEKYWVDKMSIFKRVELCSFVYSVTHAFNVKA